MNYECIFIQNLFGDIKIDVFINLVQLEID